MRYNKLILMFLLILWVWNSEAQQTKERNTKIQLPDIPGYMTLKGDFHMHTVFSDGHVWPSFRVYEAQRDGLDVISITEHIDYEGFPEVIDYNREKAFEIAKERAEKTNVLVIRGVEISPRVPPYHANAIFLKDVDAFPYKYMEETHKSFVMKDDIKKEELMAPFLEAQQQGGFVFYNHPTYRWWDEKDKELFTDFHEELLARGILGGVEVVNGGRYNRIAHEMAEKYNLTMFANSDAHYDIASNYKNSHRPITLVFAKSKSSEGIAEAIRNRRTAIYNKNYIIGRQKQMDAIFKASLSIETKKITGTKAPKLEVRITNHSDVTYRTVCTTNYTMDNLPGGYLVLPAHETISIILYPIWQYPETLKLKMEVENILVSPDESLNTELVLKL